MKQTRGTFSWNLDDPDESEIEVSYTITPGEPMTREYPGSRSSIEFTVTRDGKEIEVSKKLVKQILECCREDAAEREACARVEHADSERQRRRERKLYYAEGE